MSVKSLFNKSYGLFNKCADILQPLILLAFRLNWGWEFFVDGRGKLENHEKVVNFFTDLGIPQPNLNAWFVGGVECFGGILLLLGLASRPVAFILSINMLVAFLSVPDDRATLFNVLSDADAVLKADPGFYLLTALIILAFGPGLFSLDYLIGKLRGVKK